MGGVTYCLDLSWLYFSFRGLFDGPLFCTIDGLPIQRKLFDEILATVLHHFGIDSTKHKGRSFRIGVATFAAESGFSDAQIRAMGCWKSDAFKKYIRTPSLTTPSWISSDYIDRFVTAASFLFISCALASFLSPVLLRLHTLVWVKATRMQGQRMCSNRGDFRRRCIKIVRARELFPANFAFRCLVYNF